MTWNPFRKRVTSPSASASALARHGAQQRRADHHARVMERMHQLRRELGLPPVSIDL